METAAHILPESKRMPPLRGHRGGGGRSTAGIGGTCHGTGMTYCRYWLAAARSHEFVHWENTPYDQSYEIGEEGMFPLSPKVLHSWFPCIYIIQEKAGIGKTYLI